MPLVHNSAKDGGEARVWRCSVRIPMLLRADHKRNRATLKTSAGEPQAVTAAIDDREHPMSSLVALLRRCCSASKTNHRTSPMPPRYSSMRTTMYSVRRRRILNTCPYGINRINVRTVAAAALKAPSTDRQERHMSRCMAAGHQASRFPRKATCSCRPSKIETRILVIEVKV